MTLPLDTQLAQLESAQLVRRLNEDEAAYLFKHALVQDTTYASLLKNDHKRLHRLVAQAYERIYTARNLDQFAALLAQHYASAGDDAKTLDYATRAGDLAARVYAQSEAIAHYSLALDAAKRVGASTDKLIHLYTSRGRVFEVTGRDEQALATYEELGEYARLRGDRALELQSLLLCGKIHSMPSVAFDRAKALALADRATVLAVQLGDRMAQAQSLWNQQLLYLYNRELPDAIRFGEQALAIARELDARELLAFILDDLARAYLQAGDMERIPGLQAESRTIWRELDNKPMLADNLMQTATISMLRGNYAETIALTDEGIEISKAIDSKLSLMSNRGTQIFVRLDRGEFANALQLVEDNLRTSTEMGGAVNQPMLYGSAALIYGTIGAFELGSQMSDRARKGLEQPSAEFFRSWAWVILARFFISAGDLPAAEGAITAGQIDRRAIQVDPAGLFGALARGEYMLALGEYESAARLMSDRVAALRQIGFHATVCDALFIQAQALRALGKNDEARERLFEARAEAEELQVRRLLWQICAAQSKIETERGNLAQATADRDCARETITFIVEHTPEALRPSFLKLPRVREALPNF